MSRKMRIGILGTRGIPNRYGGFEQCAEYLAVGLVQRGHEVYVYNSSQHEYQESEWNGVHIVHCHDPEHRIGTAGQFIYDFNCIRDARLRKLDIALQLGYTSSSLWWPLWPRRAANLVNMDGLEWKRSKYSPKVQRFLKHAEQWAAKHGDLLIADSVGIQEHLQQAYGKPSVFIPYGAEVFEQPDAQVPLAMGLQPGGYDLLIARMEPENNIETIVRGRLESRSALPLVVVGKTDNAFGTYLKNAYRDPSVQFVGGIYDMARIDSLRYYSRLYFHGHSVGGTNPSLLEAMACSALIAAHDNLFNHSVLGADALYFREPADVASLLNSFSDKADYEAMLRANVEKIRSIYSWERIIDQYEEAMLGAH